MSIEFSVHTASLPYDHACPAPADAFDFKSRNGVEFEDLLCPVGRSVVPLKDRIGRVTHTRKVAFEDFTVVHVRTLVKLPINQFLTLTSLRHLSIKNQSIPEVEVAEGLSIDKSVMFEFTYREIRTCRLSR